MNRTHAMNPERPSPASDLLSAPFFEALSQARLTIQKCAQCGTRQLGQMFCVACSSRDLAWSDASGRGVVHALTRLHLAYHPAFAAELPYNAVTVELEEGPRLYANVVDDDDMQAATDPVPVSIGMAVEVRFSRLSSGVTVPVFARRPT